jgi:geranylgeranyl pyrophosphate synthase
MPIDRISARLDSHLLQQCGEPTNPLVGICRYALEGGHRTRGALLLHAAGPSAPGALQAATALEMMHAATLLQDDIFDQSLQRRGRAAAHVRFGKAQAILASDWLLVRALELASAVHPGFFRDLAGAATHMAQAVATELAPAPAHTAADARAQIDSVAQGKTAVLFATALRGAALLRGVATAEAAQWSRIGASIGRTYQLVDDCIDVYGSVCSAGKEVGHDLESGRLTLPILLACEALNHTGLDLPLAALQTTQLTALQLEAMRRTLQSPQLQSTLLTELQGRIAIASFDSGHAAIPAEVTRFWSADLTHKIERCFHHLLPADAPELPTRQRA